MTKVYSSAVVIIPPKDKWVPIQQIRKLYDRQINRWMPHITLIYPFRPENEYPNFEKKFSKKCENLTCFIISLKTLKYFNHGHQKYTLWLNPEPIDLIIDLQAEILNIVPECNDVNNYKKGFRPHLSVGQIQKKHNLLETITNLQNSWKELKFQINEIYFISREKSKSSNFKIIKRIQLQKNN